MTYCKLRRDWTGDMQNAVEVPGDQIQTPGLMTFIWNIDIQWKGIFSWIQKSFQQCKYYYIE